MKVCLITTSFPRHSSDDAGIFIARIAGALSAIGINGTIIAPHDQAAKIQDRYLDWQILRVKYGLFVKGCLAYGSGILPNVRSNPLLLLQAPSLLFCFTIQAFQSSRQSDLIHAHWLASALPGLLASILCNKPLVVTIRGEDLKLLGLPIIGTVFRQLFSGQSKITTISEQFEEKLKSYFPKKKIYLVKNGVSRTIKEQVELDRVQKKYELYQIDYLIYASRVIPLKRVEILIKLLSILDNHNIHLVICGALDHESYLNQLRQNISELKLESRVHFLGPTPPEDYAILLSRAKFCCSASEYEGRPNAVLEALAHGIPPVLSNIQAHTAIVQESFNGVLFSAEQLEDVARKIDNLLTNQEFYQKMSSQAQASVSELSWENCAARYSEVYKIALES